MIEPGRASYSIRYLMTLIAAAAAGLAVARLTPFSVTDGVFATVSVLILTGLVAEARHIRRGTSHGLQTSFVRGFHLGWRCQLALAIITYFVLALVRANEALIRANEFTAEEFFESVAMAPEMMLFLAFLSCLMLHDPLGVRGRAGSSLRTVFLGALGVILCSLISYVSGMDILLLVQVAIESMERETSLSQYDPGGTYHGLDPNTRRRTLHFAAMSMPSIVPVVLLAPTIGWLASKYRQRETVTPACWLMFGLLAVSSIYPIWLYTGGLSRFSPPFAEASFRLSLTSWIAGGFCIVMLATLVTYRSVAIESVEKDSALVLEANSPWFAHRSMATLVVLAIAALSWITAEVIPLKSNEFITLSWWQIFVELFLGRPPFYLVLIILWIVVRRPWTAQQQRVPPANVELHAVAVIWPTVALSLIISAPTISWFVYSLRLIDVNR